MEQVGTVIFGKCIIVYRAGHLYQRLHVVCVVTPVKQLHVNGSQNVTVKVEESLETEVGEGPEPISFTEIKAESEVSCVSCVFIITHFTTTVCTHVCCLFNISVCNTICFIVWLLTMFLHVIGWLQFCYIFLV